MLAEKYKIEGLIGLGGMAAVFDATNAWTGRRVAIKMLAATGEEREELVQRMMFEARAATQIAHANIIEVLDMGREADGEVYIVQEYLEGQDLRKMLDERGTMTTPDIVAIIVPIMSALEAAHARGIIHRDIKPANIFVSRSAAGTMVPKLIDFGISKRFEGKTDGLTKIGTTLGTPDYMSPEQAAGDKDIGPQTDLWSIGVVLYEALCGHTPFENENYHALLYQIITEDVPRIDERVPFLDRHVADVVHRALTRDRAKRFATVREFREALSAVVTHPTADLTTPAPVRVSLEDALGAIGTPTLDAPPENATPAPIVAPDRDELHADPFDEPTRKRVASLRPPDTVPPDGAGNDADSAAPGPRVASARPVAIRATSSRESNSQRTMLIAALFGALALIGVLLAFLLSRDSSPGVRAGLPSTTPSSAADVAAALPSTSLSPMLDGFTAVAPASDATPSTALATAFAVDAATAASDAATLALAPDGTASASTDAAASAVAHVEGDAGSLAPTHDAGESDMSFSPDGDPEPRSAGGGHRRRRGGRRGSGHRGGSGSTTTNRAPILGAD